MGLTSWPSSETLCSAYRGPEFDPQPVISSFLKQKEFIEDASHELKTPLSVTIASSEALEDNPKEIKWLNNIKSEANRMSILIKNLLELASLEKKETYILKEDR